LISAAEQAVLTRIREKRATLLFILTQAYESLFKGQMLTVEHSFEHGFFCHDTEADGISNDALIQLRQTINDWLNDNDNILLEYENKETILKRTIRGNMENRAETADKWPTDKIPVIKFKSYWDLRYGPMTDKKDELKQFKLLKYQDGFLIRFPSFIDPDIIEEFHDQPKLFSVIKESEEWGSLLGLSTIQSLNEKIRDGSINELIWVAEGLQEKRISQIADSLSNEFPWKRVITVAGPSSSGKTTFSKRLQIQLRVNGFKTHTLSMDDYFMDRDQIPTDENGVQNFETMKTINLELLSSQIETLLNGGRIKERKFDFTSGKGVFTDQTIELGEWDFILLEGIHGLNPELTETLGESSLQKIYVSAMTPLNIDRHHRVSTADNRLLRRLIRDLNFRGYTVSDTLNRWPSVREGEEKYIFPHQERADHIFNTALVYEQSILAPQLLEKLKPEKGDTDYILEEKDRLRLFLSFFEPASEKLVPGISILREFIGDSDFDY